MKRIPNKVLIACAFCAACIVIGGVLQIASPELRIGSVLIAWLGIAGVTIETFGWGTRAGYVIRGEWRAIQVERGLRCLAMSGIMVLVSAFIAGPILQVVFEAFFRK